MAFCKYCGQPVADQAAFCAACGKQLSALAQPVAAPAQPVTTPVQPVTTPVQPVTTPVQQVAAPAQPVAAPAQPVAYGAAPAPKKPNWVLLGGIAAAVVAAIVVIVLLLGGGSSPEKAFETMWDVTYNGEIGAIHDLMPDSCWTYVAQRYSVSEQMLSAKLTQDFGEQKAQMQMLGVEFDWEILNTVEANEAQLAQVRQEVMEEYECISPMSITAACALNVQINRGLEIDTDTMTAVEIDGNWYLLDGIEMLMDIADDFE